MKALLLIMSLLLATHTIANAQKYIIKIDTVKSIKLKSKKFYSVKIEGKKKKMCFEGIEGDSLILDGRKYYYGNLIIRNSKRKNLLDVVFFPISIGSCVAMSAFPVAYLAGYYADDTGKMFQSMSVLIAESLVFAISRSYMVKNKRWVDFSELLLLDYETK